MTAEEKKILVAELKNDLLSKLRNMDNDLIDLEKQVKEHKQTVLQMKDKLSSEVLMELV